jgi:hypothetical protein
MGVAVGLLLIGGVALGPTYHREQGKSRHRAAGAHFSTKI